MREKSAKIRFLRIYIECTISAVLWACLALQKTDGEGGRGRVRESGSRVKRRLKKKKRKEANLSRFSFLPFSSFCVSTNTIRT